MDEHKQPYKGPPQGRAPDMRAPSRRNAVPRESPEKPCATREHPSAPTSGRSAKPMRADASRESRTTHKHPDDSIVGARLATAHWHPKPSPCPSSHPSPRCQPCFAIGGAQWGCASSALIAPRGLGRCDGLQKPEARLWHGSLTAPEEPHGLCRIAPCTVAAARS